MPFLNYIQSPVCNVARVSLFIFMTLKEFVDILTFCEIFKQFPLRQ